MLHAVAELGCIATLGGDGEISPDFKIISEECPHHGTNKGLSYLNLQEIQQTSQCRASNQTQCYEAGELKSMHVCNSVWMLFLG